MPVPWEVEALHAAFKAEGQPLFLVGGAVRDFAQSVFRGTDYKFKDHDLATPAHPDLVEEILRKAVGRRNDSVVRAVGKSFGVILVNIDGTDFEIATFRKDSETSDGRRPDSVTFSSIEDDAARRDLTINALYYDMDNEVVLDFHDGLNDLRSNNVRFVGDAKARLAEDKLRALRFVRFYGRVNPGMCHHMKQDAVEAITACTLRPEISEERIRDEFLKGLTSVLNKQAFLYNLSDLGLMAQILPGLDLFLLLKPELKGYKDILAQMLCDNKPQDVRDRLLELKYTSDEAQDVEFLLKLRTYTEPEQIVTFHRDRKRCKLSDEEIVGYAYAMTANKHLIVKMLSFPYPTVRGEELMDQFQGRALGLAMTAKEVENFRLSL